jgi:hypothetical protein
MSDVSVSLGVTGKDAVLGAFTQVGEAGKQMGETFGSIAGKLAGLAAGYVSISAAVGAFNGVMAKGGELADFSDQTGIAAGKLVILGRAFENNGMHAEELGGIINKMQRTLIAAGDEGSAAADKIGRLGLKVSDLEAMTPDQQFETIAKAISKIQDPTERAGAAMEIFGKSGGKTLALFSDFDGQVSQASSEVGSFAEEMEKNARSFDAIGDGIGAIGGKLVEFTAGLLDESIPAMTTLVDYFKSVDATGFGKSFSDALSTGVDVALSVFTNPGNLFLAFGDALTVALKSGGKALYSVLAYTLEWADNYLKNSFSSSSDIIRSVFTASFGYVVSGFSSMLAEVFSGIAGYLPAKLGEPMAQIGNQLAKVSDDWSNKAAVGLAEAWQGIGSAAERATEQTQMQSADIFDAAGSAASLQEHLSIAADSGASVREQMQASLDHARDITAEAKEWDNATSSMADNFSGATGSFRDFAAGNTEASGLAALSGLKVGAGDVGPIASASDRVKSSASSRSLRESVGGISGGRISSIQAKPMTELEASRQTASDLGYYTGGDSRASQAQTIDDLFRKYQQDIGGNPADLRKKAEDDFNSLMNDKMDGTGGTASGGGSGGSGGSGKGKHEAPKNPDSGILSEIKTLVDTICNERLPIQVLA